MKTHKVSYLSIIATTILTCTGFLQGQENNNHAVTAEMTIPGPRKTSARLCVKVCAGPPETILQELPMNVAHGEEPPLSAGPKAAIPEEVHPSSRYSTTPAMENSSRGKSTWQW